MPAFIHTSPDTGKIHFLFARCGEHEKVPQLNDAADGVSECAACVGEDMYSLFNEFLDVLDAYADRLTHHAVLKARLASARDRLNLLAPGAGNEFEGE